MYLPPHCTHRRDAVVQPGDGQHGGNPSHASARITNLRTDTTLAYNNQQPTEIMYVHPVNILVCKPSYRA